MTETPQPKWTFRPNAGGPTWEILFDDRWMADARNQRTASSMCSDLNAAEEQRHAAEPNFSQCQLDTNHEGDCYDAFGNRLYLMGESAHESRAKFHATEPGSASPDRRAEAYLPMDCPACGRALLQVFYDPNGSPPFTVECGKCGATQFDCDEEQHRAGGPHPQTGSASDPQKPEDSQFPDDNWPGNADKPAEPQNSQHYVNCNCSDGRGICGKPPSPSMTTTG